MHRVRMRLLRGILARVRAPRAVPIASAPRGRLITVRGAVVPRDLMRSPITDDACVYYRYSIEQWRQSRVTGVGGDGFWEIVGRDEAILEFYVNDGTARAIVAPERARVHAGRRLDAQPLELDLQRRAQQLLLEPGDEIAVTGEAVEVVDLYDESRHYRGTPQRLMLRAPKGRSLDIRVLRKRAAPSP